MIKFNNQCKPIVRTFASDTLGLFETVFWQLRRYKLIGINCVSSRTIPCHRHRHFSKGPGKLENLTRPSAAQFLSSFGPSGRSSAAVGSRPTLFHREQLICGDLGQLHANDTNSLVRSWANLRLPVALLLRNSRPSGGYRW